MNTLILGFGVSGRSVARYLKRCVVYDEKKESLLRDPEVQKLVEEGARLVSEIDDLTPFQEIVVSPGFPLSHPLLQRSRVVPIGEVEFALRRLSSRRMVAVTGSNGKTTTVLLTTHALNSNGMAARAVGNVGKPLTDLLLEEDRGEILVVELSSFQLETIHTACFEAAMVLNVTENHLDRYASFEEYRQVKFSLEKRVIPGGSFYKGPISNEEAAYLLSSRFGVTRELFSEALQTFQRPAHRLEWVAEIDGVQYYNDSKATSVAAVSHAVKSLSRPILLLVGGVDKGGSYAPWKEAFQGKVRRLFGFGPAATLIEKELGAFFPFVFCESMQEALDQAKREAVRGDAILLSPGGSSFDAFRSYVHRGEEFVKRVKGYG